MKLRVLLSAGVANLALAAAANALPVQAATPPVVNVGGVAPTITTSGSTMRVDSNAPRTIIDWTTFNVAPGETVNFGVSNAGWVTLNRVANGPANINGTIRSVFGDGTGTDIAGDVWILSPQGVLFGANARVGVGGMLAGSATVNQAEFLNPALRTLNFTGSGSGGPVRVLGGAQIDARFGFGGTLALVAPEVSTEAGSNLAAPNLLYGAADTFRIRFRDGPETNQLSLIDFIVPNRASGTPVQTALNLAGSSRGVQTYLIAISRAEVAGLLINAPGLITGIASVNGDSGQVFISTQENVLDGFAGFNPNKFLTPGVTGGDIRLGTITANTYLAVLNTTDTTLGNITADSLAAGASLNLAGNNITIGAGGLRAGRMGVGDVNQPQNKNVAVDHSGTFTAPFIDAANRVLVGRGAFAPPRGLAPGDINVPTVTASVEISLIGRNITVASTSAPGAVNFSSAGNLRADIVSGSSVSLNNTVGTTTFDRVTATGAVAGSNPFFTGMVSGDAFVRGHASLTGNTVTATRHAHVSAGSQAGAPDAPINVRSVVASMISSGTTGNTRIATVNATGAIAGDSILVGTPLASGAVRLSGAGAISADTVTARGFASFQAGGPGMPRDIVIPTITASSIGFSSGGGVRVDTARTTGVVPGTNTLGTLFPHTIPNGGISALTDTDITFGTINSVGNVRLTNNTNIAISTITAPSIEVAAGGNVTVTVGSFTGGAGIGGRGVTTLGTIDAGGDSVIAGAQRLVITDRVTAPNLSIHLLSQVGGSGTSGLSNANFQRIRVTGRVDLFAGIPASSFTAPEPGGSITVLDLDVDPTRVPRLNIYAQGDSTITVQGTLRPTASGGALQIGAPSVGAGPGDFRPRRIHVTGSIGSASGNAETAFTEVRAFNTVELNAADNIIFGSPNFIQLVSAASPGQIDIGRGMPVGVEPTAEQIGRTWLTAGSLTATASQRIVSQNTGALGAQGGVYLTGVGVSPGGPVLRATGAQIIDVFGAFQSERGLVTGFSASFSDRLIIEGGIARINGCPVGIGCIISTPAAEFRIEQVDSVLGDADAVTGAAVVVNAPLFTPPPPVEDEDEEADPVVTGTGNEEIWRREQP